MICPYCRFGSPRLQPREGVLDCPSCGGTFEPGQDADDDAEFLLRNPGVALPFPDSDDEQEGQ